jgi:hypothetical protein
MLLLRVRVPFPDERIQRVDEPSAGVARIDDVVDIAS